ncbi:MAG TPA: hypothetical protein VIF62_00120 [Labilithrix sp.]
MRRSRRFLFALLVCGGGAIGACVGDDPVRTGDAAQDASTPDANGGGTDAADGSAPSDGSTSDADSGSDSGPQRFCNTQTMPVGASDFFCADFDGTNFGEGFLDASVTTGGTLTQDTTLFFSKPNSAYSAIASVSPAHAYLSWQRGGPAVVNHITLSAAIKEDFVETLGSPNGVIALLALNVGPTVSQYTVSFVYALGQANASGGPNFSGYALMVLLPAQSPSFYPTGVLAAGGGFTNVTLDYNGTTHRAEVLYNGSSVTLQPYASLTGNLAVQALVGGQSVNIGSTELQGQWNIDNVVFAASP